MPNNKTTTTFGHNLFRRCVVGRQNNVLSTLIFIDEGQKTLIQCNGPVSNILVPRYDPMLHTTVPCWLQRPVCSSATSHCPPCYEGDNENQLLDQRCRHNIKIICNLSSRDPAAQTTAVHTVMGTVQYIWGVKGIHLYTSDNSVLQIVWFTSHMK